jgi:RNA polymerase sigma-70 factor (ECF subfamily)
MQIENRNQRLSLIATPWSLIDIAHHGSASSAQIAQEQLFDRYRGAVYRYLRKLLPEPEAADEVFQEFALQLVHGELRRADPRRGRFRNYVKGTLFHLVADYRKQRREWPAALPGDGSDLVEEKEEAESYPLFEESWCDELLSRAWTMLSQTDPGSYAMLRFRADHPEMRSPQMAEAFGGQLGRRFTPAGVRQAIHRAREKFADLLVDEVSQSLGNPTPEELDDELVEVGLLGYCRTAAERRHG